MKIYYGLTEDETKLKVLKYANEKYKYKGVNTSLEGLKKFIKDNKMDKIIRYYTIIDSSIFTIESNIFFDAEDDMVVVQIPFEFEINNVHELFK